MTLTDTAGLRSETDDRIESEGIEITKHELSKAHSVLLVLDVTELEKRAEMTYGLKKRQEADIKDVLELNKNIIILLNKSDLITIGSGVPSIILSSGKKMNASFVSFASKDTAINIDLVRV